MATDDLFQTWWDQYPRKSGKSAAALEWETTCSLLSPAALTALLELDLATWEQEGTRLLDIPHAAVWLADAAQVGLLPEDWVDLWHWQQLDQHVSQAVHAVDPLDVLTHVNSAAHHCTHMRSELARERGAVVRQLRAAGMSLVDISAATNQPRSSVRDWALVH